ncbi:MAG: YidC/Oxa1 family membrane protein insertase [Patescibacteria group bacterium]
MVALFNTILYEPLFNALMFLNYYLPGKDLGIAIIILTLAIKFILYIPSLAAIKQQKAVQDIQPKLDALKKKYKDNKEELSKQLIQFYKQNKVNPLSSCLPILLQLIVLFALYRVFFSGLHTDPETGLIVGDQLNHLYGALRDIYATTPLNQMFIGFVDLSKNHNVILAIIAGGFQFIQSRMMMSRRPPKVKGAGDENMVARTSQSMTYFLPLITIYFAYLFPAGLALYWVVSTLFTLFQQLLYFKKQDKQKNEAEIVNVDT